MASVYRKPKFYLAPYNYCDRWCERCIIDKTKCEIYQMSMNDRLHHIADGVDPDAPEVVAADISRNFSATIALLREKAKEMGIDLDRVEIPPEDRKPARRRFEDDPWISRAMVIAKAVAQFIADHRADLARDFREPYEVLAFYHHQPGAKLARLQRFEEEAADEFITASAILSAQIAHQGLVRMLDAFLTIFEKRPAWRDEALDTMARMQALAKDVEAAWLVKPCRKLTAVKKGEPWWGPLKE
jgi:hypothetical protein